MPYIGNIVQDFSVSTAMLNTDSVTSIKIDDGTIVNADINDSAAIQGSKISPNFGSQNIVTTGTLSCDTIASNDITISDQQPRLNFVDNSGSPNDPDYLFQVDGGQFVLHDSTNGVNKFAVQADGHMDFVPNCDFAAGIDVTGNITTTGSITATTGTITSQDITIQDQQPRLNFVDNAGSPNDPDYLFQVDGGSFLLHDSTNVSDIFSVAANGTLRSHNNHDFSAGIDVTGAITSTGNVSVGTTVSNEKLNIHTASSLKAQMQFTNTTTGTAAGDGLVVGITGGEEAIFWNQEDTDMAFATDNDEAMRIDNDGNVGIGTSSPLKKLHLVAPGDVALMLQTTNANNDAEIWEISCGANASTNADLIFRTRLNSGSGGDERVRMTQDGQLQLSGNQLKVQNTGNCNVLVGSTNASGAAIVLDGDSDGNGSGADYAYIEHDSAGNLNIVQDNPAAGGKIDFFTGGAARVSMQSDKFRPSNNEGMTLGTSGLRWGNVYTSGILFGGDTAVANTLDDYEEGTWTPSITGTTSNLGSTSGRAFMYRRIGSAVFFSFDFFQENNNMSLNASCVIDGLPFDSPNLPNNFLSNISVGSIGNAATGNVHATVRNYFTNSAQIVILDAVANSRHFMGQGFYFVA